MGFEDEVEQSFRRPCRQTGGRSKQTYELTSSIVPRGTSFHRSVELEFPSIGFDLARCSCCCRDLFSGPAELSTVNPDAVHDHGQPACQGHDRFSNRPFGVKHFQTIHRCSVDVAHGLVLLFGIGTKALPSWDSRTRWNNLLGGLAVRLTAGPSGHANSPHPSSREGHHSTARWSSSFLLSDLILHGFHAAAATVPGSSGTRCRQPRCGA